MKKIVLLLIVFIFPFGKAMAQHDYVPMAVENAQSIIYYTDADGYPPFLDYYSGYKIQGDIEINSITYKKVYYRDFAPVYPDLGNPVEEPFFIENEYLFGAIRDDIPNERVYGIQFCDEPPANDCPCNEEFLMYDFSLEVDDLLDSCILGGILNQLNVQNFMGQNRIVQYYWMPTTTRKIYEGIGGEYGLFNRIWPCFEYSCPYFHYFCIGTDEECLDDFLLSNNEYSVHNKVSIYPNPTVNSLTIESNELNIKSITIVDVLGKKILTQKKNFFTVDLAQFDGGIYFVEIKTENELFIKKILKK